jgi:hypothetical protein
MAKVVAIAPIQRAGDDGPVGTADREDWGIMSPSD